MLRKMPVWKNPGMPIEQPATMTSRMNQTRLSSAQRIVAAPGRRAAGSAVVVMRVPEDPGSKRSGRGAGLLANRRPALCRDERLGHGRHGHARRLQVAPELRLVDVVL